MKNFRVGLPGRLLAVLLCGLMTSTHFGCFGGGGGGGGAADFNTTVANLNDQEKTVNSKTKDFADAYNNYFGTDLTTLSTSEAQARAQAFVSTGEAFADAIDTYDDLLTSYESSLGGSASSLKFQASAGVDTTASDVGSVIKDTKDGEADCAKNHPIDTDPDGYKKCIDDLRKKQLGQAANIGVGALVSGGAGTIAGLAAGAAGAPVLVAVGTGVAVGLVVGLVWTWCTGSSSLTVNKAAVSGETCTFTSCEAKVQELSDGRRVAICSVPPGTGTVTVHSPGGTPFTKDMTIGSGGVTIDLSGCNTSEDSATPSDAESCNNNTTQTDSVSAQGTDCSQISTFTANNSPADPAPGQTVIVTATAFPVVSGCSVTFSIVGTDGFSKSETPATDSSGSATFSIPGGAEGVVDTVTVTVNNFTRNLGYTF